MTRPPDPGTTTKPCQSRNVTVRLSPGQSEVAVEVQPGILVLLTQGDYVYNRNQGQCSTHVYVISMSSSTTPSKTLKALEITSSTTPSTTKSTTTSTEPIQHDYRPSRLYAVTQGGSWFQWKSMSKCRDTWLKIQVIEHPLCRHPNTPIGYGRFWIISHMTAIPNVSVFKI